MTNHGLERYVWFAIRPSITALECSTADNFSHRSVGRLPMTVCALLKGTERVLSAA